MSPIFPPVPRLSCNLLKEKKLVQADTPSLIHYAPSVLGLVRPEVVEGMQIMRMLVLAISTFGTEDALIDRATISNGVYSVEYRLLSLRSDPYDDVSTHAGMDLSKALVLAHHIFLHLAVRELPRTAKMHVNMLKELEAVLLLDPRSLTLSDPQVATQFLLWVLFIGAAAALGRDSRAFFVYTLQQACIRLQILSRQEFEEVLRKVVWLDKFGSFHCPGIWSEMFGT